MADEEALDGHLIPGLSPRGVPRMLKGSVLPFSYNNLEEFKALWRKYQGQIAAVIMEPVRNTEPDNNFLEEIRKVTQEQSVVLIFDEITSGWRLICGGAHLIYGVNPDVAVFAKGMSNGYPMSAIIGKKEIMQAAQETFISSTYWTERIGPTAAIATIRKMQKENVSEHLNMIGEYIQKGWKDCAEKSDLPIEIHGIAPLSHFSVKADNPLVLKTLFTQLMLEKGYLATNAFYASFVHSKKIVDGYLERAGEAMAFVAKTIKNKDSEKHLKGPVCQTGFRRLN